MKRIINIAVIGAGQMSQKVHLSVIKKIKEEGLYNLLTLCDININIAKEATKKFGFANYTHDANDILNSDDIDAVYIFGTVQMHYEYARKALLSGKHVFVEKPPAPDSEKAIELHNIAQNNNLIAVVGLNRRFQENINYAKKEIEQFSRIYSMEATFHKPVLEENAPYGTSSWIIAGTIHAIDILCYLMNELPIEISSYINITSGNTPQNCSVVLKWKEGTHAVLSSNNSSGNKSENYNIHSFNSSYYCDTSNLTIFSNNKSRKLDFSKNFNSRGFYGEHKEFAEAILDIKKPRHQILNGAIAQYLVELVEKGYCGKIDWNNILNKKVELININNNVPDKSILILNPDTVSNSLYILKEKYNIIYDEELSKISQIEKNKVVAIITGIGGLPIQEKYLDELPSLKVIGIVGASVKKYNPEIIIRRKIPIINVADVYGESVAEFIIMQAIIGIRKALISHETMRFGGWGVNNYSFKNNIKSYICRILNKTSMISIKNKSHNNSSKFHCDIKNNLQGSTIGIIGYGAISRQLITLLKPFNCQIKVFSEYLTEKESIKLGIKKVDMIEILNCQIVSINRGLSSRTEKSFGKFEIDLLKPGTVLINNSRAEIIDMNALIERLKKNDIFACIDVYDREPLEKNSILRKLPNVFITSHISGSTDQMYKNAAKSLVDKIDLYLNGKKVDNIILSETFLNNMT